MATIVFSSKIWGGQKNLDFLENCFVEVVDGNLP